MLLVLTVFIVIIYAKFSLFIQYEMFTEEFVNANIHWSNQLAIPILMAVMVTALKVGKDVMIQYHQTEMQQRQKAQQELGFLKAQLSPHFLLNTLNNLYGLAITKSQSLPNHIIQLSDLLRFTVYNTKNELVPLKDELNYLNGYISLQLIRLNTGSKVKSNISELNANNKFIVPMVLVVFIENAFKHGIALHSVKDIDIDIQINIEDDHIAFVSKNRYEENENTLDDIKEEEGIGMQNTLRRIKLLYGNDALPLVNRENNYYTLSIKLPLHENAEMLDR